MLGLCRTEWEEYILSYFISNLEAGTHAACRKYISIFRAAGPQSSKTPKRFLSLCEAGYVGLKT